MAVKKTTVKKTTAAKKAAPVETAVTAPVQTEKIEKAEETVKVEEKAAPAVKEVKAEAKAEVKAEPAKKTAAKKAPAKKVVKTNLFVQAAGKEVSMDEAIARVKDAWKATGHKVGDLKEITVYVKPEESSIYYVVNGDVTGRVEF